MDYCRVVGRPLDEKQGLRTNTSPLAPCKGCSKAGQRTTFRVSGGPNLPLGAGRLGPAQEAPGRWNLPAWGPRPPWGYPRQTPQDPKKAHRFGSPRLPGDFTLPHRSDGTLGRGFRSKPRGPMQMVSGALGSLAALRVLGFKV